MWALRTPVGEGRGSDAARTGRRGAGRRPGRLSARFARMPDNTEPGRRLGRQLGSLGGRLMKRKREIPVRILRPRYGAPGGQEDHRDGRLATRGAVALAPTERSLKGRVRTGPDAGGARSVRNESPAAASLQCEEFDLSRRSSCARAKVPADGAWLHGPNPSVAESVMSERYSSRSPPTRIKQVHLSTVRPPSRVRRDPDGARG